MTKKKRFQVTTYDYIYDLNNAKVIVDNMYFDNEDDAIKYGRTIEHTISSKTVVYDNHTHKEIATGSSFLKLTRYKH